MLKVLEVHIIKSVGCVGVHVDGDLGVHILRAHLLKLRSICLVKCRVHGVLTAEIVYSVCKLATMRESNGVCRCTTDTIIQSGLKLLINVHVRGKTSVMMLSGAVKDISDTDIPN